MLSRRIGVALVLMSGVLALAGCITIDIDLEVKSDDTVSGTLGVGFAESIYDPANVPSEARLGEILATVDGVTVTAFNENGFIGERAEFEDVPISVFAPVEDEDQFVTFERDGDILRVGGIIDLGDLEGAEQFGASQEDISVRITVPGEIIATNGSVDDGTNTIVWSPDFGDELALSATVESPLGGGSTILAITLVSAGIVVAIVGIILWRIRKKPPTDESKSPDADLDAGA